MKKIFIKSLFVVLFLMTLCCVSVSAEEIDGLEYTVSNGKVTITDVDYWLSGNVVIPSKIEGKTVTTIGESAFAFSDVISVVLPATVTSIEDSAFTCCYDLEKIVLNEGLKTIGEGAFSFCENLNAINIPSTVRTIGEKAFEYCESVVKIAIPSGVTTIGSDVFNGCDSLNKVFIPKSVTTISQYAFGTRYSWDDGYAGIIYYPGTKTQFNAISGVSSLKLDDATIVYGHKHSLKNKISKATTGKEGKVVSICGCGYSKTVVTKKIDNIKLSATQYIYSGKANTPTVTITDTAKKKLVKGTDYTLTYAPGRTKAGKYSVKITFKGKYAGIRTFYFKVYNKTKTLKLNNTSVSLGVGQKSTLKATVTPSNAIQTVTYSSSNSRVASVNANGVITAKKVGSAVITVKTADKIVKKCTVKVFNARLNATKKTINVKQRYTLKVTDKKQTVSKWISSNKKVATVTSKGVVYGVANGTATITAKLKNGLELKCTVIVKKATLSKSVSIYRYNTKTLTLKNASGTVSWKSSDSKVVKVSANGVVTAVKTGTATITATCGGVKYTCKVTVKNQAPITVTYVDWDINFVDGVEPEITIRNNTTKDIKYISINTSYKNRFGDPAYCEIRDEFTRTLMVSGGLMAKTTKTFYWDAAIYNSSVSRIDIDEVIITFVDNSKATVQVNRYWHDYYYYYQ